MTSKLDRVVSIAIALAAIIAAVVLVRREFSGGDRDGGGLQLGERAQPAAFDSTLAANLAAGRRDGSAAAPIQLIEFVDLQCPACKRYHREVLPAIREQYGDSMAITYVHFPLQIHRLAPMAARAAECAAPSGRFFAFIDRAYAVQDSFGIKPWAEYAREAGVADTGTFARCVANRAPVAMIDSGVALADRLELRATPTIVLNGWRYARPPSKETLRKDIEAVLNGKSPYPKQRVAAR